MLKLLWLFSRLLRKMESRIMSQFDDLKASLDGLTATVGTAITDLAALEAAIVALQSQASPDLSGLIAQAQKAQSDLAAAVAANQPPAPAAA